MFLCIKTDIFVASSLIQIKLTYAGKMLRQIAEKLKIVKKCQLICLLQPMNHNLVSQPRRIEFIFFRHCVISTFSFSSRTVWLSR